ncbi:unnamed protein product [Sphacelaria rigidula]
MKQSNLPSTLILEGKWSEDVPAVLDAFLNRVRIHSPDDCTESTVQRHAMKHSPRILRGSAETLHTPLGSRKVEWRPLAVLQDLKSRGKDTAPIAPKTWTEWVAAYTHRFSPPNQPALLARAIPDLKQEEDQNVDDYALECTTSMDRFVTEALRVKFPGHDTLRFIIDVITTAFETGLKPHIRVEMVREDSTLDFQTATARAKKYEQNNLRTWQNQTRDTPHVSAATVNSPPPQLAEMIADHGAILTDLQSQSRAIEGERGRAKKRSDRSANRSGGELKKVRFKDSNNKSTSNDKQLSGITK